MNSAKPVTESERMTGEELRSAETPAPFALELEDAQGLGARADNDPGFIRAQDFARGASLVHHFSLPDLEHMRLGLGRQKGEGAGPGDQAANAIPERTRGLGPIETAVQLFDFRREGDAVGWLGLRQEPAGEVIRDGPYQQLRADLG